MHIDRIVTLVAGLVSAFAFSAPAAEAVRPEPAMVMLRFSSAQTQSLGEWRQTAKAFAANRGCCDN